MDEEVKFGENIDTALGHDITNGADPKPKKPKENTYRFCDEFRQICKLVGQHSGIYVAKFLFLFIIVTGVACIKADSYSTLIISSFTLLGSLLFDQLCIKKLPQNYDFIRAERFCLYMGWYIFFLFLISLFLLCTKDDLFPNTVANTNETFWTLSRFKWFVFCFCCSADLSALVEAVANIPEASLPSKQEKTESPKAASENQKKGEENV